MQITKKAKKIRKKKKLLSITFSHFPRSFAILIGVKASSKKYLPPFNHLHPLSTNQKSSTLFPHTLMPGHSVCKGRISSKWSSSKKERRRKKQHEKRENPRKREMFFMQFAFIFIPLGFFLLLFSLPCCSGQTGWSSSFWCCCCLVDMVISRQMGKNLCYMLHVSMSACKKIKVEVLNMRGMNLLILYIQQFHNKLNKK